MRTFSVLSYVSMCLFFSKSIIQVFLIHNFAIR